MINKRIIPSKILLLALSMVAWSFAFAAQPSEGWYVRIIAENSAEGLIDRSTVLGELPDSSQTLDVHDLPELEPFSAPFLTAVFKQDSWGDDSGEFSSDFRKLSNRNPEQPKQWRFTIKSDNASRDVTLRFESDHRLDQMVMVDLTTGLEFYPIIGGLPQEYTFNMNGENQREFLWKY